MKQPVITLLTDFGYRDGYVASMKGVILEMAPNALMVDAAHDVPPQQVAAGAWTLCQYWDWYPEGTIHVAVVDPGVGSSRHALLVRAAGRVFIGPDNGLFTWVLEAVPEAEVRVIHPEVHHPRGLSSTFHGRDVFAYAAALLASGVRTVEDISSPVRRYVRPDWAQVRKKGALIAGRVIHVDHFGNLITNIAQSLIPSDESGAVVVTAGHYVISGFSTTYSNGGDAGLIALWGSSGHLELAVPNASARSLTGLAVGAEVSVRRPR